MYLSSSKTKTLSQIMRALAEPCTETDMRLQVGEQLLTLLDADYYASYAWNPAADRFEDGVCINMSSRNFSAYDAYYQYRDPITPMLKERRQASLVVQVMEQKNLMKTEFFNDFLKPDGLHWGVNLHAWDGDANVGDIRIWRKQGRENFNEQTLGLLNFVQPAFTAAITRAKLTQQLLHEEPSSHALLTLSAREKQIVALIGLGHSDKEIARKLEIGFTTVRTHIGKVMRKLAVKNRVQVATICSSNQAPIRA